MNISHVRMQSALPRFRECVSFFNGLQTSFENLSLRLRCGTVSNGRVAQRQSSGLLSHWFRVRISARSQVNTRLGCFYFRWRVFSGHRCFVSIAVLKSNRVNVEDTRHSLYSPDFPLCIPVPCIGKLDRIVRCTLPCLKKTSACHPRQMYCCLVT